MGYADNAFGSCHRELSAYAYDRLTTRAARWGFVFDDRKVHLHGSTQERDVTQCALESLSDVYIGEEVEGGVGGYVVRPDISGSRLDLATCLGVPIPAGKEDSDALQEWLAFKADAVIQYSSMIIELRDACLGEDVLSTEDPACPPLW
jgi:hypothetical protein